MAQDYSSLFGGTPADTDIPATAAAKPAAVKTPAAKPGATDYSLLFGGTPADKAAVDGDEHPLFKFAINQESGGKQFDKSGKPLTSKAGAIGIAQVMPGTAPEAARLAGLPYDEMKYRTDPAYNRALGHAYFKQQLADFGGDESKALAAYNAGPAAMRFAQDNARKAGTPDAWLRFLPAETQSYVPSIMGAARRAGTEPGTVAAGTPAAPAKDPYMNLEITPRRTSGQVFKDGVKSGFESSKGLAAGFGALLSASLGNNADEGLTKKLLDYSKEQSEKSAKLQGDAASFTDAMAEGGDLGRWVANSAGYLGYQVAEAALSGGLGAILGKAAGKEAVATLAAGMVEKEVAKLVASGAAKTMSKNQVEAIAAGTVSKQIGAATTIFANNMRQEGGSIYGDALEQAEKTGEPVSSLGRIWLASFAAAGVDTAADVAMAKGVLGLREGSTAAGFGRRVAAEVPKGMGVQGGTEAVQTVIEQVGAKKDPLDPESVKETIDSAAVGALGGVAGGGVTAIHKRAPVAGEPAAPAAPADPAMAAVQAKAEQPNSPLSKAAVAANTPEVVAMRAAEQVAAGQVNQIPGQAAVAGTPAEPEKAAGAQRLAELEAVAKGTPAAAGQPAVESRFFTPEEKAEYDSLKEMKTASEEVAGTAEKKVDKISERVTELTAGIRDGDVLQRMRDKGEDTKSLLRDLAVAQSPSTPAAQREQALGRVEFALDFAGQAIAPAVKPADADPVAATLRDPKVSDTDRESLRIAQQAAGDTRLPAATRQAARDTANEIVGRYAAPAGAAAPAGQAQALTSDTPAAAGTPEESLREADRLENGAFQFKSEGFDTEAAELQAQADSQREEAATRREAAAEAARVDDVPAPKKVATPAGAGPSVLRKRKATLAQLAADGMSKVERRGAEFFMVNATGKRQFKLDGPADAQLARSAIAENIRAGAELANTNPTEAQAKAGNYKKGRVEFDGLKIAIENPMGSTRRGTAADGTKWETKLAAHYGDVEGTKGADGDPVDVYLVDHPRHGSPVFVVDQYEGAKFDETKVVLGVASEAEALRIYDSGFSDGSGPQRRRAVTRMTMDEFKAWVYSPAATKAAEGTHGATGRNEQPGPTGGRERLGSDDAGGVADRVASTDASADAASGEDSRSVGDGGQRPAGVGPAGADGLPAVGRDSLTVTFDGKSADIGMVKAEDLADKDSVDRGGRALRVTKTQAAQLQAVASAFGKQIQFFNDNGVSVGDGFVRPGDAGTIFLNQSTGISPMAVLGHELMHLVKMDNPKAHAAIEKVVAARLTDDARAKMGKLYADGAVLEEITSDLGGDLMTDTAFWGEVLAEINDKSAIAKLAELIYRTIDRLVGSIRQPGFDSASMVTDMTAIRAAFRDGLAAYAKDQGISKAAMQAEILRAGQDAKRSAERAGDVTQTAAFKKWFGDSKIVDAAGKPLVVYHGSTRGGITSATVQTSFFTSSREVATTYSEDDYASSKGESPIVQSVYLKIENPLDVDAAGAAWMQIDFDGARHTTDSLAALAKRRGHDGLIIRNVEDNVTEEDLPPTDIYVTLGRAGQIKSAEANNGDFDAKENDITRSADRNVGIHYSKQPRAQLDGRKNGTGMKGGEAKRLEAATDPRIKDRVYAYIDGRKPEDNVGGFAHEIALGNLYDADRNAEKLWTADANAAESAILDAGYDGYTSRGVAVIMGDASHKVEAKPLNGTVAEEMFRRGLLSKEIEQILPDNIPGAELKAGTLVFPAASRTAANTEMARIGSAIRFSKERLATPKEEYAAVVAQHKGTPGWRKAPDGTTSQLTERQWVQVRTPSFMKWFGPWLQAHAEGGVWAGSLNVSKVVGKNGEPLVVYHGSDKGGFMTFDQPGGEKRGDIGIFATPNESMAYSYVRKGSATAIVNPEEGEQTGWKYISNETGEVIFAMDLGDSSEDIAAREKANKAKAVPLTGTLPRPRDQVGVYGLFMNLRDVAESDFEGAHWNGERHEQWIVEVGGEQQYDEDGKGFFTEEEALERAKSFVSPEDEESGDIDAAYYVRPADEHYENTDSVARSAQAQGLDGAIVRAVVDDGGGLGYDMMPSDIFVAFDPNQVKSADFNEGSYSVTDDDIRRSRERVIPESIDEVTNVDAARQFAGTRQFATNRDFKLALQDRANEAAKSAKVDLSDYTPALERYLTRVGVADAMSGLRDNANAVGWYNEKVTKAMRLLGLIHPELQTDPEARFAFTWALAVTSNGLKVNKNFELAEAAYQAYKKTGKMPTDIKAGQTQKAINESLGLFNELKEKWGMPALMDFATTKDTVANIEKSSGLEIGGEGKKVEVFGAAVLGPKIGNGFFMNLYGEFGQLTMDRWLMRTWGRWTGTLVEVNKAAVKRKTDQLSGVIRMLNKDDKKNFESIIRTRLALGNIKAVAESIRTMSAKPALRDRMNKVAPLTDETRAALAQLIGEPRVNQNRESLGSELRKTGNMLAVLMDGQKEAPASTSERAFIRQVFGEVLGTLQSEHQGLTMSDLQAVIWYPERRLYDAAKTSEVSEEGYADNEAPDYANAAAALARAQGVDESKINQTINEVDNELQSTQRAGAARRNDAGPQAGRARARTDAAAGRGADGGPVPDASSFRGGAQPVAIDSRPEPSLRGSSLIGLPAEVEVDGKLIRFGAFKPAQDAARAYAAAAGIKYSPPTVYAKVDPARARRVADAFEVMTHNPEDPVVKSAYQALIKETEAQYQAMLDTGLKVEFITGADPYGNPRNAIIDVVQNNHLWVYPTDAGFGGTASADVDITGNPLLAPTKFKISGKPALANDIFRAVHDYYGHVAEGVGFRESGEENAWRKHASMFSPAARRALTTETRGQNSWVNYGPHAAFNRVADGAATQYAPQKIGLLPEWVSDEGRTDADILKSVERTPQFDAWFKDSKVVDAAGEPLVMYHGSDKGDISEFAPATYFTEDATEADGYQSSGTVYPVYISIKNPYEASDLVDEEFRSELTNIDESYAEYLTNQGYDGVIARRGGETLWAVPFKAAQIKSAVGNDGNFDAKKSDITRSAERSPAFKKWFGDSKVVDVGGRPLVVYHGTTGDFTTFDERRHGSNFGHEPQHMQGFYFTPDESVAESVADTNEVPGSPRVIAAYLSLQNPLEFDAERKDIDIVELGRRLSAAKKRGHDGAIIRNWPDGTSPAEDEDGSTVDIPPQYVAFRPEQIKSATGNNGDFSASSSDITRSAERTPAFDAWFKDSKIVDADGAPRRVFTGTSKDVDFAKFKAPSNGIWFSDDPKDASAYAVDNDSKGLKYDQDSRRYKEVNTASRVLPVYLSIQNPKALEAWPDSIMKASNYKKAQGAYFDQLKADGFDGVTMGSITVAFEPTQIKSATGNRGKFDSNSADITRSADRADTAAFKKWFGDSKVVDATGKPMAVYHGTTADFSEYRPQNGLLGWFTADQKYASDYPSRDSISTKTGSNVQPVYLSLQNPAPLNMLQERSGTIEERVKELREDGYDGVMENRGGKSIFMVFAPTQIKSAIGNRGTFDSGNADITRSVDRTNTPEFKAWFDGSKVVKGGKPLVVYHGTTGDFGSFDGALSNRQSRTGAPENSFFFSDSPQIASSYTVDWQGDFSVSYGDGANVLPVYLSIKNPLKVNAKAENWRDIQYKGRFYDVNELTEKAQREGYDGLIVSKVQDKGRGDVDNDIANTYVAFNSSQVKSATGNLGTFDASDADITRSAERPLFYSQLERSIEGVPDRLATMAAPQWRLWLDANAGKLGVKKEEIEWSGINDYLALRGKDKVTRDELAAYMRDNGVKVREVVLGDFDKFEEIDRLNQKLEPTGYHVELNGSDGNTFFFFDRNDNEVDYMRVPEGVRNILNEERGNRAGAKYATYTVPGGENYRELLITLPVKNIEGIGWTADRIREKRAMLEDGGFSRAAIDRAIELAEEHDGAADALRAADRQVASGFYDADTKGARDLLIGLVSGAKKKRAADQAKTYKSSHWDQPNILAHLRVDDRTDADGKRVLFINEVQSDWGQDGKKKGFNTPLRTEGWTAKRGEGDPASGPVWEVRNERGGWVLGIPVASAQSAEQAIARAAQNGTADRGGSQSSVPSAPFVQKTEAWVGLALKRAIVMAAQQGYDRVAIINGQQAADLYDLSKRVDSVMYEKFNNENLWELEVRGIDGEIIVREEEADVARLEELIGKDLTKKIVDGDGDKVTPDSDVRDWRRLSGLDLQVGGEGMKTFYDKIVPQIANDVLKKLGGGKVGDVALGAGTLRIIQRNDGQWAVRSEDGDIDDAYPSKSAAQAAIKLTQQGFDITPAMREKLEGGAPLFSKDRTTGDNGRAYTPEQAEMFKNTGRTVALPTLRERVKEARQDIAKKMAQGIVDAFHPIKELGGKGYTLARLSKGSAGAFEAMLNHGKLSLVDGAYDADMSGGFIQKVGEPLAGELEDFMWWIASNRAEQLKKEDREHLFTEADIDAGKSLATGQMKHDYTMADGTVTRDRAAAYRDSLVKFDAFNKNTMDIAEQSGLIDGESRQFWEGEFYVPFYRISEADGEFAGAKIKGGLGRQRAFKELKGGGQKLNSDLLANTMKNWAHLIDASAKNRAAKATLESAQDMGAAIEADAETVRQLGKSIDGKGGPVWFMDGGKQRHFLVGDPYLLTAINSIEYAGMKGPLMDAMSKMKHILTVGVTASPAFKVRNLIRDTISAIGISGLSYNPVTNLREGFKASARDSQDYVSALASGGLIRFGTMMEGNASERVRSLVKKGVKESTVLDNPAKVKAFYDKFVDPAVQAYHEIGNRGEEVNRSALYTQLKKQGMGHAEASLMARDLMDFSMQGTWTTIRFLTQVVPFMNARMQGLYKLGRAAKEDPKRFAVVTGAVALFSVALLAAYGDDDDWKKREDFDRDGFWWFKFGGTAFRIPKPFEIGAIATIAERGVELFTNDQFTAKRFRERVLHLVGDNLAMNPIPQALKPILDVYANKDTFSGRPIESMGMERLQSEYRFNAGTSMVARAASTAMNTVSRATIDSESLSPVQIDSMLRGYFGWLGTFVVGGADMAMRPLTSEPSRPQADYMKVVTQGFLRTLPEPSSKYVSAVYEQAKILEEAYATHRQLVKDGKVEEAKEFADDNQAKLAQHKKLETVKKIQAAANGRIREIEKSDVSPAEKRDAIQKIRDIQSRSAELVY